MSSYSSIVENRMSSALIMEDDMDWDIRIKDQVVDYARGVRSFLNQTEASATHSPYGDGWDVLWMGRCNDRFVDAKADGREIFAIENDATVPLLKNLRVDDGRDMLDGFPDNTRLVHRVEDPICTFAYAVSLQGARKILYKLSIEGLQFNFDNALSWWCTDSAREYGQQCIGATPTYFSQHRIKSGSVSRNSDNFEEQGFSDQAYTHAIRWSTRMNVDKLLRGETDFSDTYPDYLTPPTPEEQRDEGDGRGFD